MHDVTMIEMCIIDPNLEYTYLLTLISIHISIRDVSIDLLLLIFNINTLKIPLMMDMPYSILI